MRKALITAMSLALAGAFVALSVPADAAKFDRAKSQKRFERLDANNDGVLESSEFAKLSRRQFDRFDANGDGYVTSKELAERRKAHVEKRRPVSDKRMKKIAANSKRRLSVIDTDGDGRISEKEFVARVHPFVKNGDTDGDGVLSESEFHASIEKRRARRMKK